MSKNYASYDNIAEIAREIRAQQEELDSKINKLEELLDGNAEADKELSAKIDKVEQSIDTEVGNKVSKLEDLIKNSGNVRTTNATVSGDTITVTTQISDDTPLPPVSKGDVVIARLPEATKTENTKWNVNLPAEKPLGLMFFYTVGGWPGYYLIDSPELKSGVADLYSHAADFTPEILCVSKTAPIIVAADGSKFWYTEDGINWKSDSGDIGVIVSIAYGDGMWVATTNGAGLYYSMDGKKWRQTDITGGYCEGVAYGGGLWIARFLNRLWYSLDGKTWDDEYPVDYIPKETPPSESWNSTRENIYGYSYADGVWWLRTYDGLKRSTDYCKTWVDATPSGDVRKYSKPAYVNDAWFVTTNAVTYTWFSDKWWELTGQGLSPDNGGSTLLPPPVFANGQYVAAYYDGSTYKLMSSKTSDIARTGWNFSASVLGPYGINGLHYANDMWYYTGVRGAFAIESLSGASWRQISTYNCLNPGGIAEGIMVPKSKTFTYTAPSLITIPQTSIWVVDSDSTVALAGGSSNSVDTSAMDSLTNKVATNTKDISTLKSNVAIATERVEDVAIDVNNLEDFLDNFSDSIDFRFDDVYDYAEDVGSQARDLIDDLKDDIEQFKEDTESRLYGEVRQTWTSNQLGFARPSGDGFGSAVTYSGPKSIGAVTCTGNIQYVSRDSSFVGVGLTSNKISGSGTSYSSAGNILIDLYGGSAEIYVRFTSSSSSSTTAKCQAYNYDGSKLIAQSTVNGKNNITMTFSYQAQNAYDKVWIKADEGSKVIVNEIGVVVANSMKMVLGSMMIGAASKAQLPTASYGLIKNGALGYAISENQLYTASVSDGIITWNASGTKHMADGTNYFHGTASTSSVNITSVGK